MKKYSELLRDPRWQKTRLEILNRDEFTCQNCFDSDSTLNVHHCFYERGKKPWEYPRGSLLTLCDACHEAQRDVMGEKIALCNALSMKGWLSGQFNELAISVYESDFPAEKEIFASALSWAISEPEMRNLILDLYARYLAARRSRNIQAEGT